MANFGRLSSSFFYLPSAIAVKGSCRKAGRVSALIVFLPSAGSLPPFAQGVAFLLSPKKPEVTSVVFVRENIDILRLEELSGIMKALFARPFIGGNTKEKPI